MSRMSDHQYSSICATVVGIVGMILVAGLLFSMGYCTHRNMEREDNISLIEAQTESKRVEQGYVQEISEGQIIWVLPDEESDSE